MALPIPHRLRAIALPESVKVPQGALQNMFMLQKGASAHGLLERSVGDTPLEVQINELNRVADFITAVTPGATWG